MKNKCSIYVLETNDNLRKCFELYIKSLDWLEFFGSSEITDNSVDLLLTIKPNILILNNVLPIISNEFNINKIKKLNNFCNIYIISGRIDDKIVTYSYKLGIRKYIKKPCDFNNIFNIIYNDIIKSEP